MRLKLYRAPGMAEAMARVRAELGSEALILATRRVKEGVEITAAVGPTIEPASPDAAQQPARLPALRFHGVPAPLQQTLQTGPLDAVLARSFRFAALPLSPGDKPLLFVGPPGAGKTFATARLATRLVLSGLHPVVITADGKRAGAVAQLAAFTRLLGLQLRATADPQALGRALVPRSPAAPVLIDTPGCDPFDAVQAAQLAALAAAAGAALLLVLPAGLDPAEAAELARAYAGLGATLLLATRLDVSPRLGGILAAASAGGLALTEAGIGPGVADGLAPLTPASLADRLRQTRSQSA